MPAELNGHASRADVETAIDDMPDHYIECRRRGHRWTSHAAYWDAENRVFEETLRCTRRCKVRKIETLSEMGSIIQSKIDYSEAEGYLLRGLGRVTTDGRDAIRLASITRRMQRSK